MALNTEGIIGQSSSLRDLFKVITKVAPTDSTVLVTGESGTGKEVLVRALHANSLRADKPFIPINCGAIPRELLESELFGHEKGAFTHAIRSKPGRFELGDTGTVFLDEIGEMDLPLQVKILRVLQEREIERVGGTGVRKVDVRIIAATNRDLEEEVRAGRFREDLYYRLNVIPLHIPPLRERGRDILILADFFLHKFCEAKQRAALGLNHEVQKALSAYSWPGNVRELENFMERLSILADGPEVIIDDLPGKILNELGDLSALPEPPPHDPEIEREESAAMEAAACAAAATLPPASMMETTYCPPAGAPHPQASSTGAFVWPALDQLTQLDMSLKEFMDSIEERLVQEALARAGGVKNQAAELLGIKRTTLIEKLKKMGE